MRKAVALALALAACVAVASVLIAPTPRRPRVWVTQTKPTRPILPSHSYPAFLHWSGISASHQTSFYITANGTRLADVQSSPYAVPAYQCGRTFALGVEAHDGSGKHGPRYTTNYTAPPCAPMNVVAPYFCGVPSGIPGCSSVTGDAEVGQALVVGEGTWTNSPTSYAYQWEACTTTASQPPQTGSCEPLRGATSNTYTVQPSDVGKALVPIVTARNSAGTASTAIDGPLCTSGSTPGGSIGTRAATIYPDPVEPAGCSPISAVAGGSPAGETFCTNAPVTCGFPDPLAGTAGVPPATSLHALSALTCNSGTVSNVYVTGRVTLGGTCTLRNSRIIVPPGGLNLEAYSNLTLINDEFAGAYSGESSATTGLGEVANVSARCTYSYSDGPSTSYDLVFDGSLANAHLRGDYFHCAVEPLNGHAGATDSYLISDEAAPGTHNEAVYEPGGDPYVFRNDVMLNPWSQTAALFTDCSRDGPPAGATIIGNLAATYGSNGALGVQDGSNPSCARSLTSNITVEHNRFSYIYNASMPCGYANGPGVNFTSNVADDTGRRMGSRCGG